jgi:hypothetical protein
MLEDGSQMKLTFAILSLFALAGALAGLSCQSKPSREALPQPAATAYLGFDRNILPDVSALPMLRKTFAFTGYWLSPPPGETTNTWIGKRDALRSLGFGFILLYRGPLTRELKNAAKAAQRGVTDARDAAAAAKREGFPAQAILFIDIEEGGRLSDAYHAYLKAWAEELPRNGFHAGAYCSGIPVKEEPGRTITTAEDIRAHMGSADFSYFVCNDACPPSPGCTFSIPAPSPAESGTANAAVWQYVRSPREMEFSARCPPGYHTDGNCYVPGDTAHTWHLDVNSSNSADPSNGR